MLNHDPRLMGESAKWLSVATQLFSTRMNKMLAPHQMTLSQFSILNHIAGLPEGQSQRISDIADAVEVNQPAVTKVVNKFENLGLVELQADVTDQRARRVRILPKGLLEIRKIQECLAPDLERMFAAYSSEELANLTSAMKRLAQWLDGNRL